jgi:hypothetical protein
MSDTRFVGEKGDSLSGISGAGQMRYFVGRKVGSLFRLRLDGQQPVLEVWDSYIRHWLFCSYTDGVTDDSVNFRAISQEEAKVLIVG